MKLPCCGYVVNPSSSLHIQSVVKYNPGNDVVQCHACGEVWVPIGRVHELTKLLENANTGRNLAFDSRDAALTERDKLLVWKDGAEKTNAKMAEEITALRTKIDNQASLLDTANSARETICQQRDNAINELARVEITRDNLSQALTLAKANRDIVCAKNTEISLALSDFKEKLHRAEEDLAKALTLGELGAAALKQVLDERDA